MKDAQIDVSADGAELARRAAEWLVEEANAVQGTCRIALSGGSTPRALYTLLAAEPLRSQMPWDRLELFWGDERFVPPDDKDSNYRMARETMLDHVPIDPDQVHRMPTEGRPEDAAQAYEDLLKQVYGGDRIAPDRPFFDIMLLGMGPDGHTASLLPGSDILDESAKWVAAVSQGRPEVRLTLTYPLIDSSRTVAFLLSGAEKAKAFAQVRAGDMALPAARVDPVGKLLWFVDQTVLG
ncbi:MAG TPA: 6-phosphogluconolactonase [Aliidongia sp.]|nr:6-phosphogluconolactonase [Aliidongia sp.]